MTGMEISIQPMEVTFMVQCLGLEERIRIEVLHEAGTSIADIAFKIGRDRSTVYRELKRNSTPQGYDADAAQAAAEARARRPETPKLACDHLLRRKVLELLHLRWSPHAVSQQLHADGHQVCAETIYQACYDPTASSGLPQHCWRNLPSCRRRRKPRSRCTRKPSPLKDYRPIADRCETVRSRKEPGHWEGDLMIGADNKTAVATLTERVSRHTLVVGLPGGYDAASTAAAVTAALSRQPEHLVRTLTWDQGREMANWSDIETSLGIKVYFCDARSPWQRPTNEQTNGLLRRWLPKGTNLNIGPARLAAIEDNLNTMPRKLHAWESAHTVYTTL